MAKDAKTAGSEFLAEVLATLPPEQQAQAKALLEANEAALTVLGNGALRQGDYSRQSNDLKQQIQQKEAELTSWHADLTTWFDSKKADLAELDEIRSSGKRVAPKPHGSDPADPTTRPAVDLTKVVTPDALRTELDAMERGAVGFFDELSDLKLQHFIDFHEILNTRELLTDKRVQQLGLRGVYQDRYKDQLAAKAKAADDKRIEAIRTEERDKLLKEMAASQTPYPVRGNEPSSLDAIEAARSGQTPQIKTVEDMAAEYARLGASR